MAWRPMLACPLCRERLVNDHDHRGICWSCRQCGGELFTAGSLRSSHPLGMASVQQAARHDLGQSARACPMCRHGMARVQAGGPPPMPLDVCDPCRVVWFDRTEYEAVFPTLIRARPLGAPPPKREIVRALPWMTIVLGLLCIGSSWWLWSTTPSPVREWSYLPADPWRHHGATLVTAFFLHLTPLHLLGNLGALWFFGRDVEEKLGRLWFAAMLLVATVAGWAMHGAIERDQEVMVIGASGGFSGLITYFCLRFPHRPAEPDERRSTHGHDPLSTPLPNWLTIPESAITWMVIWLLMQIAGAAMEHFLGSPVAYGAHLGGAAVGILWFIAHRFLSPPTLSDRSKPWWLR